ncbi:MAG: hypothetical protein ACKOBV_10035 [Candidatus Kapaibacterium sp.]
MVPRRLSVIALVFSIVFSIFFSSGTTCRAEGSGDIMVGGGVAMQFATLVNTGWHAGYDVNAMAAVRLMKDTGLHAWAGYERYRTSSDSIGADEVRAFLVSVGLRADLRSPGSGIRPFLLLGFGVGESDRTVVRNSVVSIRNTAMQFGVGIPVQVCGDADIVPMLRFIIGADSGFTIPLSLGLRWNLQ